MREQMKTLLRAVGSLIYTTFIVLMIFAGLLTLATQTSTIALFSTQSGSMLPRYPVNALLVVVPTDWETIKTGDAIFVQQEGNGRFVFHRVINISDTVGEGEVVYLTDDDGATYERVRVKEETPIADLTGGSGLVVGTPDIAVQLQGDANPSRDGETYLITSQVWKPVIQVKGGGHLFDALSNPHTMLWVGGVLGAVLLGVLLVPSRKEEELAEEETQVDGVNSPRSNLPTYSESRDSK